MDTPQVTGSLLASSAEVLLRPGAEAALGRASDGGWWALGVTDPEMASVLSGVPMSQSDTGARTFSALVGRGWTVVDLVELRDVDEPDDVLAVSAQMAADSHFAQAVARLDGLTRA